MLEEITAKNLGLIGQAAISPSPHLTVITGETGTGKTLMLGALRLLSGENAAKGLVGPHGDEAQVSGRLVIQEEETVIRRTVGATRSRAYLNDAACTAGALADLTADEISIVGQHDQHAVASSQGMRSIIDHSLSPSGDQAKLDYASAWLAHRTVLDERAEIGSDVRSIERERDTLAFQASEINDAALISGEDADLQQKAVRLRNAEAIASDVAAALTALSEDAGAGGLTQAIAALRRGETLDRGLRPSIDRLEEVATSMSDATGDLAIYATTLDVEADTLVAIEERIALIATLKRKYGETIDGILSFGADASGRESRLADMLDAAQDIDDRLDAAADLLVSAGTALVGYRVEAAEAIAAGAEEHLKDLGFSSPVVRINVQPSTPTASGADSVLALFSSDAALEPGAVSAIASGGELSRLVLALTLAAGTADTALVAFDEIDAGVGGATALALGEKLSTLANDRQVICVTHLPQVAAFGDTHIAVTREGTETFVTQLSDDDRVTELARMLAGLSDSDRGKEHAAELLTIATDRTSRP